ncbi:hypothetical protein GPECTOR_46g258 [Gonium pectorale]|uniref:glycerophosphodiester phosphodiesterase n=1 Tax=Gonium pectorale TaxID=33097 RepID=A0A150G8K7_GONPE|nr:hypothetical protein GPECTOR_46g258 [Gonium pectorale]|eukprot:KXZ46189.1 hypothetical protein GPECTOR_46g258 [Gonium pectorale]
MAEHPRVPIQIDLKVHSPELVRAVSEMVSRHSRERLVLWGSFLHTTNSALYTANPRVPLFASAPRALLLLAAFCAGRLADVHVYESAVIIPWRLGAGGSPGRRVLNWWQPSLLLPDFFRQLNARGVSVVLYGDINDQAAFEACSAAGANAICTDSPSRLMRWLEARRGGPTAGQGGAGGSVEDAGNARGSPSGGASGGGT